MAIIRVCDICKKPISGELYRLRSEGKPHRRPANRRSDDPVFFYEICEERAVNVHKIIEASVE